MALQQPGNKETDVTCNTTARSCNDDNADGSNECQGDSFGCSWHTGPIQTNLLFDLLYHYKEEQNEEQKLRLDRNQEHPI